MNDAEKELLICLIEECAEIQKEATKLLRFGRFDRDGKDRTNLLCTEIGDFDALLDELEAINVVDSVKINAARRFKVEKLKRWLKHHVIED